jgi:agmatine deiminase
MPAEWEAHEATWIAWPHERTDWPGKFAPIPFLYGEIVRHLARVERVKIVVDDAEAEQSARAILRKTHADLAAVDFIHQPTDRSWLRDTAPIFVRGARGKLVATHWRFNGWAKYDNYKLDALLPAAIASETNVERVETDVVLEGGSIDVDGTGRLLTTEECLLSEDVQIRNPGMGRAEVERALRRYLGATDVIWLGNGIVGDDTHGHIDDIARFTAPGSVVACIEPDKSEANHALLADNLRRLRARKDLRVATLPMPEPVYFNNQRLPASYANFYIANGIVLVPAFSDPNDRVALNTLARLFPDREVIGIPCRDLVLGLGTLHCMTQQEPRR